MSGFPSPSLSFWRKVPNQVSQTVSTIYPEKHCLSQSQKEDAEHTLRLWDMGRETSLVRRLIRNKILHHLNKKPLFREWESEEKKNIAGYIEEKLFAKAESQVHYMDLSTLERRLIDFIDGHRNVGDSTDIIYDVSSTSISSATPGCEMSHNREPSSPNTSCITVSNSISDPTTISSTSTWTSVQVIDLDNNPYPVGGLSDINCYLPNGHHHVVASQSIARNVMDFPETTLKPVPAVSTYSTEVRTPSLTTSNHYIRRPNSNVLGDNWRPSMSQMPSKVHLEPLVGESAYATKPVHNGTILPENCAASSGFVEDVHLLDNQINLISNSTYSYPRSKEHMQFLQGREQKNSRLSCQWPYLLGSKSDQLQQKGLQQQYLLVENKFSDVRQPHNIVSGLSYVNGCTLPYQLSLEPKSKHGVIHQRWSCVERSKRKRSPTCESSPIDVYMASIPTVETIDRGQHSSPCYRSQTETAQCPVPVLDDSHVSHEGHAQDCKEFMTSTCVSAEIVKHKGPFFSSDLVDHEQPLSKRIKTVHPYLSPLSQNETTKATAPVADDTHPFSVKHYKDSKTSVTTTAENMKMVMEPSSCFSHEILAGNCEVKVEDPAVDTKMTSNVEPSANLELLAAKTEQDNMQVSVVVGQLELKDILMPTAPSVVQMTGKKLDMLKKKGISLIDSFTPETIREHISSLKASIGQRIQNAKHKNGMQCEMDEKNTCSLCGLTNLRFEPPARYCASCFKQINPKGVYYLVRDSEDGSDGHDSLCTKCHNIPGENVKVGGRGIPKANMERRENFAETDDLDEPWVQCDKCSDWLHQICALFNSTRNEVKVGYTCPTCFLQEIENGEHEPLPRNTILGAADLPNTMLSDHIEQRLFRRLKEDRQERANSLGKNFYDVPAAEGLVVRVVSSFVNKVEVKQAFRDIFQEEKYPSEFPYKSKAILLFQKLDGADVCLFGMYVQEYGSGCAYPNKRHVCISYIDSVNYFRPKTSAASGEALRTFVYHEILIGYLEYCKKRGFTSCYIWACPPLKRDDYILYCHPKLQKMPKADKLREWYQTMIRKAQKDEVVVEHTNLHNQFFVPSKKTRSKLTAARLPYFDNDHWPVEAERFLQTENGSKPQKQGRKAANDRALRAARRDIAIENPKDILLMKHLGEIIRPIKEDFIVVHLQHACKHCCHPILSGKQWVCTVCKNFQLCEECFLFEQNLEKKDRHRDNAPETHSFFKVEVEEDLADTGDDETIRSEVFDTRYMFLGHCQSSHYQFDTLRRAKHSTMMFLYDIHKAAQPLRKSPCVCCHNDIDGTQRGNCVSCTGYELHDSCYQKEGTDVHNYELVRSGCMPNHNLQPSHEDKQAVRKEDMASILIHANMCKNRQCKNKSCRLIKLLFLHGKDCPTRAKGGCVFCRKMWALLNLHARGCNEPECSMPRCRDLKEARRKRLMDYSNRHVVVDAHCSAESKERIQQQTKERIDGNSKIRGQ